MPIYDQSYRSYDGTLKPRFRWVTMISQELRILSSKKMFIALVLLGNFHFILRIIQIYIMDVVANQSTGSMVELFEQVEMMQTGTWVYFDFLRFQSPLIFITLLYAGSGLICNDFRNNLMEVYFSKPINWRDYVMGKVMTLVTIGMALSALPALLMGLVHVIFMPTMASVRETMALAVPTIIFSLLLVASISLAILASSSLINSSRFASITVLMVIFINMTVGTLIALVLGEQNLLVIAFPISLNSIGESLFQETRYVNPIDLPWIVPAVYILLVCAGALGIISGKVRRAEIGQ